jgi:uncharacterized membrane protein YdjX (TVP38/TMEM64 family)
MKRSQWLRLGALVALLAGLYIAGRVTGLHEDLSTERVRALMQAAGIWGFAAFVALFAIGELLHVPGLVFVGAAVLAYGRVGGGAASFVGALVSLTVSFIVVRTVGGKPLGAIRRPLMARMLAHLDDKPIRTVALLRLIFWMGPLLNYGLALSSVRYRDYLIGSALGLVLPIAAAAAVFDWVLPWLTR